jgi:hypothetical protein
MTGPSHADRADRADRADPVDPADRADPVDLASLLVRPGPTLGVAGGTPARGVGSGGDAR